MTPQETDLITTLLTRLKSAAGQPKDPEADALIRQTVSEMPDAPYYLVQTVLIQDLSLHSAQQRIAELEKQVSDAQAQAAKPTSFLGSLFGHSQPAPPPPAQAQGGPWARGPQVAAAPPPGGGYAQPGYAQPGYAQPGYAQPGYPPAGAGGLLGGMGGGGGFLRSAAATAAGVAGGALLFEGISSLFGHNFAGGLTGASMTPGLGETVVNNYYGDSGGQDYGAGGGSDYAGGQDYGTGGGSDYAGGQDSGSGQDYSSGQDYGSSGSDYASDSGSDFGGGDSSSSC